MINIVAKKGEEDCTKKTDLGVKEFFCSKDAKYQCIPKECEFGWKQSVDRQSCECDGYKDDSGQCAGRDAEHCLGDEGEEPKKCELAVGADVMECVKYNDTGYQCAIKNCKTGWRLNEDRTICNCDGYVDDNGHCSVRDAENCLGEKGSELGKCELTTGAKTMMCVLGSDNQYACTPESCVESDYYQLVEGEITNQCVCTPIAYRNESGECVAKDHDHCGEGDKMEDMAACNANEKCNDSGVCELKSCEERCEGIGICDNDVCENKCDNKDCKKCNKKQSDCDEIEDEESEGWEEELAECKKKLDECKSTYSCSDEDVKECNEINPIICKKYNKEIYAYYAEHLSDFVYYFKAKKPCDMVSKNTKDDVLTLCNGFSECGSYKEIYSCVDVYTKVVLDAMAGQIQGVDEIDIATYVTFLNWFALCK